MCPSQTENSAIITLASISHLSKRVTDCDPYPPFYAIEALCIRLLHTIKPPISVPPFSSTELLTENSERKRRLALNILASRHNPQSLPQDHRKHTTTRKQNTKSNA